MCTHVHLSYILMHTNFLINAQANFQHNRMRMFLTHLRFSRNFHIAITIKTYNSDLSEQHRINPSIKFQGLDEFIR